MTTRHEIHAHWSRRAKLGQAAGTNDLILKQLEIDAIASYVSAGMRILDAGCGNGFTAAEIARRFNVSIEGFDFSEEMVQEARAYVATKNIKGTVSFHVGDLCNPQKDFGTFDMVYSERAVINLLTWSDQKRAISSLCGKLNIGGCYVMCENSQDGLDQINRLRGPLGLDPITPPWHNRYLLDKEIQGFDVPGIRLEAVNYFTSTYYFLSRVVNAALAAEKGHEPDYEAPVNRLALKLPPLGELGQTRIWLWRKVDSVEYGGNGAKKKSR